MKTLNDLIAAPAVSISGKDAIALRQEVSRVKLCGESAIEIGGMVLMPDKDKAYCEFFLSHSFPVVTVDQTALHPQVVANSCRTMLHKVFDLNHLIKRYDPKNNPRDRILGTIVAVELTQPAAEVRLPEGGWKVQGERSQALGIRAVAVMHKAAELVPEILQQYFTGEIPWTVSMEQEYNVMNSGFAVPEAGGDLENWTESTPEDLRSLGWTYVPTTEAPMELLRCFDAEKSKMNRYRGRNAVVLFGGLDGTVRYQGVGLTPEGREKEAMVGQMLASAHGGTVGPDPEIVDLVTRTIPELRDQGTKRPLTTDH